MLPWILDQTTTALPYFTLDDGDIIMESCDGVAFRLDSLYLRRSSSLFETMLSLPPKNNTGHKGAPDPIILTEDAITLDYVFRALYPVTPSRPIKSPRHAVEVMQALEKYQILIETHNDALSAYIGFLEPPIKAWALAVKGGSLKARAIAVRRFMEAYGDGLEYPLTDLKGVDSWDLMHLLALKKEANSKAQELILILMDTITCNDHRIAPLLTQATANPFALNGFPESLIEEYKKSQKSSCERCTFTARSSGFTRTFRNSPQTRNDVRLELSRLLDQVVDADRLVALLYTSP
ncbi:hypothetical protein DL93DRAFT_2169829 [Clavulina sp. PMI_390]|nr:hypothetical protein DL93DRAFT_2169829 [Clavulina sp. PMI_390]